MKNMKWLLLAVLLLFPFVTSKAQVAPQVTVSCGAVTVPTPAALTYKVERATAQAGPFTQVSQPASIQFMDTNVTRGTTYFYRVRSSCPATAQGCGTNAQGQVVSGDSAFSTTVSATPPILVTTPGVPTNVQAVAQ